jgi:hypothetical protein
MEGELQILPFDLRTRFWKRFVWLLVDFLHSRLQAQSRRRRVADGGPVGRYL